MKNCNLFGLNLTPTISTQKKSCKSVTYSFLCGKAGIRTLGTRKGTTVFETAPIDHSGTFPFGLTNRLERVCDCKVTKSFWFCNASWQKK